MSLAAEDGLVGSFAFGEFRVDVGGVGAKTQLKGPMSRGPIAFGFFGCRVAYVGLLLRQGRPVGQQSQQEKQAQAAATALAAPTTDEDEAQKSAARQDRDGPGMAELAAQAAIAPQRIASCIPVGAIEIDGGYGLLHEATRDGTDVSAVVY